MRRQWKRWQIRRCAPGSALKSIRASQTPEALNALRKAEAEKWWPIIRELGIKAE
jgi:hypothetical protein